MTSGTDGSPGGAVPFTNIRPRVTGCYMWHPAQEMRCNISSINTPSNHSTAYSPRDPDSGQLSTHQTIDKTVVKPHLDDSHLHSVIFLTLFYLDQDVFTDQENTKPFSTPFPGPTPHTMWWTFHNTSQSSSRAFPPEWGSYSRTTLTSYTRTAANIPLTRPSSSQSSNPILTTHTSTHSSSLYSISIRMCPPTREMSSSSQLPSQGHYQRHIQCDEPFHKRDHPTPWLHRHTDSASSRHELIQSQSFPLIKVLLEDKPQDHNFLPLFTKQSIRTIESVILSHSIISDQDVFHLIELWPEWENTGFSHCTCLLIQWSETNSTDIITAV